MSNEPRRWDEGFDKEFFTPEEIEASDMRVVEIQRQIEAQRPDRTNVIKGLKCISGDVVWCAHCPYSSSDGSGRGERCKREAAKDALALLKAQEPKLVHVTADINHRKIGECPTCGKWINSGDYPNYCGHCGQAVKWE